jgi:bifunctional UDP-N-acetylglucosamine pyrophosphorylase/glucosamine-1-phosphate N-acetyltransferase
MIPSLSFIVLAAGKGTRMHAALPKVLHPLMGKALLYHVLDTIKNLNPQEVILVVSPELFPELSPKPIHKVIQDPPLGTGHGVQQALLSHALSSDYVGILFGDVPGITESSLKRAFEKLKEDQSLQALVVAMEVSIPNTYGRMIIEENRVVRIVEVKDAQEQEKAITLCNTGIMFFKRTILEKVCHQLTPSPITQEYYLTDVIELIQKEGGQVGYTTFSQEECQGVNTQEDLARLEEIMQNRKRREMLSQGVRMQAPHTVFFSHDTQVDSQVVIEPYVVFGPKVCIKQGSVIHSFSYLEGCQIDACASVGPFARLRPGTHLGQEAKVGNFVEVKNSTLGLKTKVSHLSYVGDAHIGQGTNIGAGTITCNYDGVKKSTTYIGDKVFIGSNTALIAPLTIGHGALIAAGSTVTNDVPAHALTIARGMQRDLKDGAKKILGRRKQS